MNKTIVCTEVRISLDRIRSLKEALFVEYGRACVENDPEFIDSVRYDAQEVKRQIHQLAKELKDLELARMEKVLDLKNRYQQQVSALLATGLIGGVTFKNKSGEEQFDYGVFGVDSRYHRLPTYEDVRERLYEQRELMRIKIDQGFTKLLLVPFAAGIRSMVSRLQPEKMKSGKVLDDGAFTYADVNRTMRYLTNTVEGRAQEQSKEEVLTSESSEDRWSEGWRVLLFQTSDDKKRIRPIPATDRLSSKGTLRPRKDIGTGGLRSQHLERERVAMIDSTSPYTGESPMCFEDWLFAAADQQTPVLDGESEGEGTGAWLSGCVLRFSDDGLTLFLNANYSFKPKQEMDIDEEASDKLLSDFGPRMVVRL